MIPNKEKIKVTGNLVGEDVKMSLDEDSADELMDFLTDLYSDPEFAVIREYATNAYDSHVEAGVTDPIEFEIPSRLNPAFTIRDFGVGLNAEDIREVYSKYGASTKRNTNEQAGTLGLGGKAALTLTDQFTVIGTKDGICTTVAVSRSSEGGGTMKIISEEETDERNGVEVIVPASPTYRLAEKVNDFFRFWPSGSVLVDGNPNEQIEGIKIGDSIQAFDKQAYTVDSDYIVMGNVPYPVDFEFDVHLVAYVPIGAVDFPPNRETLRYNKLTKGTIERIKQEYINKAQIILQGEIDQAKTKSEALRVYDRLAFLNYSKGEYTYQGDVLPKTFAYKQGKRYESHQEMRRKEENRKMVILKPSYRGRGSAGIGEHQVVSAATLHDYTDAPLVLVNYNNKNWAAPTRRKLNEFVLKQIEAGKLPEGTRVSGSILVKHPVPPARDWIDVPIIDWQEVKAFRSTPAYKPEKVAGTYDVWGKHDDLSYVSYSPWRNWRVERTVAANKIDRKAPLFYDTRSLNESSFQHLAEVYGEKTQIVVVSNHRLAKFKRTFPEAKSVVASLKEAAKEWWNKLPHYKKQMLRWDRSAEDVAVWFVKTPLHKIKDPQVREVVELLRCFTKNTNLRTKWNKYYAHILNKDPLAYEELEDRYPLLESGIYGADDKARAHALYYVNAVYEAEKGKN